MRLAENPELEFEFVLAERLGRTVAELRRTISAAEFMEWQVYYGRKEQARQLAAARRG